MAWVPLHVHSQYSILRSTASVEDIVARAQELSCPAIALTDQGNLFGAVEFYKECVAKGVHPIIGCEIYVAPGSRFDKKKEHGSSFGYPLTLLVQNQIGYQNLCKLSSAAHLEGFYYVPRVDKELLALCSEGLLCLSGPLYGKLASCILQQQEKALEEEIAWLSLTFPGRLYLELQRHKMSEEAIAEDEMVQEPWLVQRYEEYVAQQEVVFARLIALSKERGIPCVATPDIHYIHRKGWRAHEILLNIQSGETCETWERDSAGRPKG
ncbi:MAG: PHP domain-containing protein, partial [Chlamydiae bacterium]|nr:PHP domain-containing protein [Chlamydiota bacterium]